MNKLLQEYSKKKFLADGNPELLNKIRPAFLQLISTLENLDDSANEEQRLLAFSHAFILINSYEDEIETIERETILEAIHEIGTIVGLDPEREFAEEWRGDW